MYKEYKENSDLQMTMHCIKAIAFLPVESMVIGYDEVQKEYGHLLPEEMFEYLDNWYIGVKKGRGKNAHRLLPHYPLETWSVYDRLMTDQPRSCH